jgi:uracil-DNA glycosylase
MNLETETLEQLVSRARSCRKCCDAPRGAPIPQEPNPLFQVSGTARICIASQAPGVRAHNARLPFADRSGERLRAWMGVTPDEFYDAARVAILPIGFCFPGFDRNGNDLPPRRECAPTWRARFLSSMPRIELILCIGSYAQAYHLAKRDRTSLTEVVKDWKEIFGDPGMPVKLPLPHPSWRNSAWLKRNPWFESELVPFLQMEVRRRLA